MSLREEIVEALRDDTAFIISVLLFPDMEPDPAIAAMAAREHAHVVWGADNIFERLEEIAARTPAILPARCRGYQAGGGCGHRRSDSVPWSGPGPGPWGRAYAPAGTSGNPGGSPVGNHDGQRDHPPRRYGHYSTGAGPGCGQRQGPAPLNWQGQFLHRTTTRAFSLEALSRGTPFLLSTGGSSPPPFQERRFRVPRSLTQRVHGRTL